MAGVSVSRELLNDVLRDPDAETSAFVVVAHKFPLASRVVLDLRIRELVQAHDTQRRAVGEIEHAHTALRERVDAAHHVQRERADAIERRQDALSAEVQNVRRVVDASHVSAQALNQPLLRKAHDALLNGTGHLDAVSGELTRLRYAQQIVRIRGTVQAAIPEGSTVLVVSKGDPRLLDLHRRIGWHFLQTEDGRYAGHHPKDSGVAISALDQLRAKGAEYLLFPCTAVWWLEHYAAFATYLDQHFAAIVRDERSCVIYALTEDRTRR